MTRMAYEAITQAPEHLRRQIKHHAQTQEPFMQETNIFIQKIIYFDVFNVFNVSFPRLHTHSKI